MPICKYCVHPHQLRAYVNDTGTQPHPDASFVTPHGAKHLTASLSKRIYRYWPDRFAETSNSLATGETARNNLKKFCSAIVDACDIYARTYPTLLSQKNSFSYVCEAFHEEFQIDSILTDIRNTKYFVLHIVDTGTPYPNTGIESKRSLDYIMSALK